MNPLARLMERIRRPVAADKVDAGAAQSAPAEAGRSHENPQMNVPGAEPRANEEPAAMYPYPPQPSAYPQAPYPYAPQQLQPGPQFQAQPAYPPQYAQPHQYPPHFAPQPVAYPYPPAQPPQPAFHAWQPQPVAFDVYGRPQPVAAPYAAYPMMAPQAPAAAYPQRPQPGYAPAAEPHPAPSPREMSPIEEVRESLREFRDAIRDLTESRARRPY